MSPARSDSVAERLLTRFGIVLQQPAYSRYYPELGEISSYPPGYKENAGVFCHNNPWIMIAEALLGRGEQAYDYYRRLAPAFFDDCQEIHRTEPYVYAQMIAGPDAPRPGQAKNSWLTGTAAWNYAAITQFMLGIRPSTTACEYLRRLRRRSVHFGYNVVAGGGIRDTCSANSIQGNRRNFR